MVHDAPITFHALGPPQRGHNVLTHLSCRNKKFFWQDVPLSEGPGKNGRSCRRQRRNGGDGHHGGRRHAEARRAFFGSLASLSAAMRVTGYKKRRNNAPRPSRGRQSSRILDVAPPICTPHPGGAQRAETEKRRDSCQRGTLAQAPAEPLDFRQGQLPRNGAGCQGRGLSLIPMKGKNMAAYRNCAAASSSSLMHCSRIV